MIQKTYNQHPLIVKAIKYIIQNNISNINPYHNIFHLFYVFKYVNQISTLINYECSIDLYIAALFHDYEHAGKMGNDSVNIGKAIDGVIEFKKQNTELFNTNCNLDNISHLIKCTEYPYVIQEEDLGLEGKIIRDADMSYMFEDISIVALYYGLNKEFGNDLEKFLENQEKFLLSIKFYTEILQNF
jgi:hypothetical protein